MSEKVSIVIPVFNEHRNIPALVEEMRSVREALGRESEVILVDDGSEDGSGALLDQLDEPGFKVIHHTHNRGYGASLKTGIRAATHEVIAITDADGTYPNKELVNLLDALDGHEMVVGARVGQNVNIPAIRKPAKWLLVKLASYLVGYRIPDLNSGLRVFRRESVMRYIHLLPDGFSFTTTITLAMLSDGLPVKYLKIDYFKRGGSSKIRPIKDTLNFIQLIVRTVVYFDPLKFFIPLVFALLFLAAGVGVFSGVFLTKFMDVTVGVIVMTSVIIFAIGILADLIVKRTGKP